MRKSASYRLRILEEAFGIFAGLMELCKLLDNAGTVGSISHAEPSGVGVEDLYCCLAVFDEGVDAKWNEEFRFGCVDVLVEEFLELTPTSTPAPRSISMPRPPTLGLGSIVATTTRGIPVRIISSAHGGVLP